MNKLFGYIIILFVLLSIDLYSQENQEQVIPRKSEESRTEEQVQVKPEQQTESPSQETRKPPTGGMLFFNEKKLLDAIDSNPKNPEPYLTLIKYYTSKDMRKERLKIAIKYIQNIGANSYMYQIIGDENRLNGEFSKALISYQYALKITPNNHSLYNRIGLTHLKLENYNQAETAFKAAIFFGAKENNMTKATYYNNLAVSYEAMGDIETALKYFKISVKIYPYYQTAIDNIKRLEKQQ